MSQEIKKYGPYDHLKVRNYLPHRYPFLFVDKILSVEVPMVGGKISAPGTKVVGQKNATINEPYYMGHFPSLPITPGVILVETMAQVACFAVMPWVKVDEEMRVLNNFSLRLAGVDNTRFRRPVVPGDILIVTMEVSKHRGPIWAFKGKGEVDGSLVVESEILASVTIEEGV
jgi:3-hydroxyacyl-[acyl-carrier-protein] dehydratase